MMVFLRCAPVVTSLFLIASCATYNAHAQTNVAMYYGQGPYQQRLLHFCEQSTVDIIPLAFVNIFPAQGNGFPGTNFGNQCSGSVYAGPGNDSAANSLLSSCPELVADIPVCQSTYGKKILLSLGGGLDTYSLTGAANGTAFADFLWGAFGPQNKTWIAQGLPRPFDGPNGKAVEVDGFDFDIEFPSSDNQAGYIALIQRLRVLFATTHKAFLISGAPQCVVPDANMGQMISQTKFDIIWIQYYNTPQCSARNWVTANPNYLTTGVEEPSGFSFDAWEQFLVGTASSDAKLFIGLPGSTSAAGSTYYLSPIEASSIIKAYYCKKNFVGIMIWESTYAENNNVGCGETYYQAIKEILLDYSVDGSLKCVQAPAKTSTSSKSSCTVTSTTTSTTSKTIPTVTPTPPCTEAYMVQPGDYCYLIWTEFGITEAQLYAWNPTLDSACDLQIGQILCVAESTTSSTVKTTATSTTVSTTKTSTSATSTATAACTEYYTVQSGDYCYAIWTEFGITEAQLYAFNPTLDSNCDLQVGQVLCVSETPLTSTSTTKTSTSSTKVSTTKTSTSSTSTATAACTEYYTVQSGDYCYAIWTEFGITEEQLYAFNPTLDSNCDLQVGQVLCVSETPSTSTSKTSTSVTKTTTSSTKISTTKTSSSTSPTASACTKYYTVQSGDYCYAIWTEFGITEAQLYAFNPTLDSNCDLQVGQVLCVSETPSASTSKTSTSVTKTTTSSTKISTTKTSSSTSPTASACTKYYTVQSGDYCYAIWTEFGITEAQLYSFNPTLDSNCDLQVGQVLCVSETPSISTSKTSSSTKSTSVAKTTSSTTSSSVAKTSTSSTKVSTSKTSTSSSKAPTSTPCTKTYTVQSGDYCYAIWTEFGITEAQLYAYNPSLDSNCDLSVGQVLCVSEAPITSSKTSSSTKSSSVLKTTSTSSTKVTGTTTKTTSSSSKAPTSTPCTKYYTVQSGDYCYAIWTEFGITEAQLYAYNPSLDSNCDLSVGQILCVSEAPVSSSTLKTSTTSKSSVVSTSSKSATSSSKTSTTVKTSSTSSKTSSTGSKTSTTLKTSTTSSVKSSSSSSTKKSSSTSSTSTHPSATNP